jgi:hypothetical protein
MCQLFQQTAPFSTRAALFIYLKHTCCCHLLQCKLLKQADRTLELLEVDEAKYADELSEQQQEFSATINTLASVSSSRAQGDKCVVGQPYGRCRAVRCILLSTRMHRHSHHLPLPKMVLIAVNMC